MPNPARNAELSKQYAIEYFPSVLLMTADGVEYLRTSNIGVGAAEYLEHVKSSAIGAKRALLETPKLKEKYARAEDKAPVVREAIALITEVPLGASSLADLAEIVRQGLTLDPENKSGLLLASLTGLVKSGTASPGENELALTMDPANALGLFEVVVSEEFRTIQGEDDVAGMDRFLAHAQTLFDCGVVHQPAKVSTVFAVAAYFHGNVRQNADKAKTFALKALEVGELPGYLLEFVKELAGLNPAEEAVEEAAD